MNALFCLHVLYFWLYQGWKWALNDRRQNKQKRALSVYALEYLGQSPTETRVERVIRNFKTETSVNARNASTRKKRLGIKAFFSTWALQCTKKRALEETRTTIDADVGFWWEVNLNYLAKKGPFLFWQFQLQTGDLIIMEIAPICPIKYDQTNCTSLFFIYPG